MGKRQHLQSLRFKDVEVRGAKFNPGGAKKMPSVTAEFATTSTIRTTMQDLMDFSMEGRSGATWEVLGLSGAATLRSVFLTGSKFCPDPAPHVKVGIEILGTRQELEEAMLFLMRSGSGPGEEWEIGVIKDFLGDIPPSRDGITQTGVANMVGDGGSQGPSNGARQQAPDSGKRKSRKGTELPEGKSRVDLPPPTTDDMVASDQGTVDKRTGMYVRDCIYVGESPDQGVDGEEVASVAARGARAGVPESTAR